MSLKQICLKIIIENDIPHINSDDLKNEIEETEKSIIHHNFMKYMFKLLSISIIIKI